MKDTKWLESSWATISSQLDVDKIYLETHRDLLIVDDATLEKAKKFFSLSLQEEKEVVLILVKEEIRAEIMRAVSREVGLDTPGRGIVFSLPVEESLGLTFIPFKE